MIRSANFFVRSLRSFSSFIILISHFIRVLLLVADGVDVVDGIDEGGELAAIQPEAGEVVVGQGALERGIAFFHGGEGGVDLDRDVALLGMLLDVGPAGGFRQVEDIFHGVERHLVEVFLLALRHELGAALFELVGDEFEEDQREHHVLVFGGLDAAAQLGGGFPEGFLEGFFGFFGGLFGNRFCRHRLLGRSFLGGFLFWHVTVVNWMGELRCEW